LQPPGRRPVGELPIATYITDEFVTWLRYANAGMLEIGNLYLMLFAQLSRVNPQFENAKPLGDYFSETQPHVQ
jgi:hypothetical protein